MNTPILKFIFFIFAFFLFLKSSAQDNYLSGFVISQKGDTLSGYIDYKNWNVNPKKITFKKQLDQNPIIYTPANIKSFGVHDEIYLSAIVNTETSPRNTKDLNNDASINLEEKNVFLQILVNGNKNLYSYEDEQYRSNFYIYMDDKFMLLNYKKYLKNTNFIAENTKYKGQLTVYLNDCSSIQSQINNTKYDQESLTNVFEKYYKCIGSEISFKKSKSKIALETGIVAGVSITNLTFDNKNPFEYLNGDYEPSSNLAAGLFLNIVFPSNEERWSIYNEVMYTSYSTSNTYKQSINENIYTLYNTEIEHSFIEMNNLLRYKHALGNTFIFLNGGISNAFVIKEENYLREESHNYSNVQIDEREAAPNSRNIETGFLIGTGLTYKKIGIEVRYEITSGVFSQLESKVNRVSLLLSYKI